MIGRSRIGLKPLAQLCRRLAIASDAGIDIRRIWEREASNAPPAMRARLVVVRDDVAAGRSLTDAVARSGDFFPVLFRELVHVGEQTGSLVEVFRRLADYYEHRLTIQRIFLAAMMWPMLQLGASVVIIGFLIWIMGVIGTTDPLGLGLAGTSGLLIYMAVVGSAVAAAAVFVSAMRRGLLWTRPVQRGLMRIPGMGRCLQTMAVARLAWVLHLTLNVEMDLRRVLPLALRSTGNDYYSRHADSVVADVVGGYTLHEAFRRTGVFNTEFLDVMEVGEESGKLVESLGRLSERYEEQARAAVETLATLTGFAVWGVVAAIIIFFIFRLAFSYIGTLYEFMP